MEWFVKHGVHVWSVNEGEQRFESHTDHLTNYIRYWQADGEGQSEIFEKLQIIASGTFTLAQKLMAERVNEYSEQRTMLKNISGQAMPPGTKLFGCSCNPMIDGL